MMDKPISELTYKIIGHSVIEGFIWEDAIDWAYDMLLLGYDTPGLAELAGITKPSEQSEVQPYLKAVLKECGLDRISNKDAEVCFYSYFVKRISAGNNIQGSLQALRSLYRDNDMEPLIQEFWLLGWAWADLVEYGADHQWYWKGATKENIELVVLAEAQKWLKEHENQLNELIIH